MDIKLFKTQYEFLQDQSTSAFWIGGRGSGKSFCGALWVLNQAMKYPGCRGIVASSNNPQLKQATIPDFHSVFDLIGVEYKYNEWNGMLHFGNGSSYKYQSLDVPEDTVKGGNLSWLFVDEVDACPEGHIKKLALAVRADYGSRQRRYIGNSPAPKSWVEKWTLPRVAAEHGRKVVGPLYQSSMFENYLLPADSVEAALLDNPPGTPDYRRWILGEMGVPLEGAVYTEFDPKVHCVSMTDVPWHRIKGYVNGLDLGYNHYTVFLRGAVTDTEEIYIFAEHSGRMMLLREHYEMMSKLCDEDPAQLKYDGTTYCDTDLQDRAELWELGFPTVPAIKDDKMASIDVIQRRFKDRTLFIVEDKCPRLLLEMPYYVYDPKKDEPVKKDDHAMDAMRYLVGGYDLDRSELE